MSRRNLKLFIDRELLIDEVRKRPIIWAKSEGTHKARSDKQAAWCEIFKILIKDYDSLDEHDKEKCGELVIKKWIMTRGSWVRSLNYQKKNKGRKVRPYIYHEKLLFLKDYIHAEHSLIRSEDERDIIILEDNNQKPEENYTERPNDHNHNNVFNFEQTQTISDDLNENEAEDITLLNDNTMNTDVEKKDQNLSFFKNLLPTLALLDDDQTLEFHSNVIHILQDIKKKGRQSRFDYASQEQAYDLSYQTGSYIHQPDLFYSSPVT